MKSTFLLILFTFLITYSPSSKAVIEICEDLHFSGLFLSSSNEAQVRSHSALLVNLGLFSIGPIYFYSPIHSYLTDTVIGGRFEIGDKVFIGLDAGKFERKYENLKGEGYAIGLRPGVKILNVLALTLPVLAKRIDSGDLEKRWVVDFYPMLGLRFDI